MIAGHYATLVVYPHCSGFCRGGRAPCTCDTGCTELDNDIPPDADRVIQPPPRTREDDQYRARTWRWAAAFALACWLGLAMLLRIAEHEITP